MSRRPGCTPGWRPNVPDWWNELAAIADETAPRYSAAWYEHFIVLYGERYPEADECSRENLRMMADSAALREANGSAGVRWRGEVTA